MDNIFNLIPILWQLKLPVEKVQIEFAIDSLEPGENSEEAEKAI
jgi:hypothetical protein